LCVAFAGKFSSRLENIILFATHFASASNGCVIMAQRKFQDDLAYPPRAMKADRAAAYLDMSRSKFLELVDADRLPKPKVIGGMRVWDRLALDAAFSEFPERGDGDSVGGRPNTFDAILRD
jgi:predicted DNA-binding transcriptional regulator AlpA